MAFTQQIQILDSFIVSVNLGKHSQQNEIEDIYEKLKGGRSKKPKTDVTLNKCIWWESSH